MTDDDIELPEYIQELVNTYGVNYREIENQALDMVCSVEIPMFSVLRDLSAQKCYSIMARMREWFGSTPGKQHYLCLMIVTDYISCAYNNTDFYGTFNGDKKDKFYESFFTKLWKEWKNVFNRMPMTVLPSLRHFEMLKNSLQVSIARFPNKFMFKWILTDIKSSCDEYGLKLKKYLSDLKASQDAKLKANFFVKSLPVSSSNSSIVVPIANVSKLTSVPIPCKNVQSPIVSKAIVIPSKNVQSPIVSKAIPIPYKHVQTPFVSKAISLIHEAKKATAPPNVIVIDDSPVKMDRTQLKLGNITNVVKERPSSETYEVLKPLDSEVKRMKFQNGVVVSEHPTKNSLPRKLNAFDILMRKKVIKTVS